MRKADLELGRRHSPILSPDPRPWLGTCANRHPGCPGKSRYIPDHFLIAVSWKPPAAQILASRSADE